MCCSTGSLRVLVEPDGMGGSLRPVTDARTAAEAVPAAPDIDENGVDRAQIRAMLALAPAERLLVIQNLADSVTEIRRLNGTGAVR